MATTSSRFLSRVMISPAVALLFIWMIVPLAMTIYFSFQNYNLLMPGMQEFIGWMNYEFFLTDPAFMESFFNTLQLVCGVLLSLSWVVPPSPCYLIRPLWVVTLCVYWC